jgi:microcystin-dependent protein
MSLSSTIARSTAIGSGSVSTYPWTWLVNEDTDLHVAVLSPSASPPQVLTVLTLGTDYTIQSPGIQIGNANGGNIVLTSTGFFSATSGDLPVNWAIVIRRAVVFGQPSVLGNQAGYNPASVESAIDYIAMQTLQLQDALAHTVQTPLDDYATPTQGIPIASLRAGGTMAFDSSGNPTVIAGTVGTTGVSIFSATLLALTSSTTWLEALGFVSGLVQSANIAAGAVVTASIGALQVTTDKIAALAVTASQIANATITNVQIAASTILASNLDPSVGIFISGDIKPTLTTSVPTGWLACNGQLVLRATYASLYTAIGTSYGSGDGSLTFALPDFRGRFLRGLAAANATGSGSVTSNAGTFTAHGLSGGMRVQLASGSLTGLSASTNYWLIVINVNTLKFSSTRANAIAGTADITISGANTAVIEQYEDTDAATRVAGAPGGNTGISVGTYEEEQFLSHYHTTGTTQATKWGSSAGNLVDPATGAATSGSTGGNETRPRNIAVNYLIKT